MAQNARLRGLGILILCSLLHPAMTIAQQPALNLMPLPANVQPGTGSLRVDSAFSVAFTGYTEPRLERASEHPLGAAIVAAAQQRNLKLSEPAEFTYAAGKGIRGIVDGRKIAVGNAVLMEYIGAIDEPAPRLIEVELPQEEAQPLFDCIMRNIELALIHGRIHGDLSAYNVLYWQGAVILIDFAQAVDPYHNSDVFSLFARDIERTCRYFASYGINTNPWELARQIWTNHMGPVPELV